MTAREKIKITPEMASFLLTSPGWSHAKIIKEFKIPSKTLSSIANGTYMPKNVEEKQSIRRNI